MLCSLPPATRNVAANRNLPNQLKKIGAATNVSAQSPLQFHCCHQRRGAHRAYVGRRERTYAATLGLLKTSTAD